MKTILWLFVMAIGFCCQAQEAYWQQQVNVTIDVKLDDATHSLDGFETIEYINNSPDTLTFIYFHLWPNAYKNDRTAFSEQLLQSGRTDFYFSKAADKGYINQLNFKVDGQSSDVAGTNDIDIIRLMLPNSLAPGKRVNISTPFHVQLPKYFSRGGHYGDTYQVTQWFPKPAVYDSKGWHAMPYLDQGEFYSEFGNYDVQITLPSAYTVAATGILQQQEGLADLKTKGKWRVSTPLNSWRFQQDSIHDFAWFASKEWSAHYDSTVLASGKIIDVFSFYNSDNKAWKSSIGYAKDGLLSYSNWLGDYPYSVVSIVEGPANVSSGGMEYPTITLITTAETGRQLDATIVHEVGHNWFYGALASNERQHPWMDEGMNTYYQLRYESQKYAAKNTLPKPVSGLQGKLPANEEELILRTMMQLNKDEAIDLPSTAYSSLNYGLSAYTKAALWMKQLEEKLGEAAFDRSMKQYYNKWKFKHPYPQDFQREMSAQSPQDLSAHFSLLHATGTQATQAKRTTKFSFIFNANRTDSFQYINLSPVVGFNKYDKIMPGLLVHNYQLPLSKLQFIAGGLYGTGSKKMNSFGRAGYTWRNKYYDVETALSFINYSQNDFSTAAGEVLYSRVRRIVPSVKLTLFNKDPEYRQRFTIQLKSFLLKEDGLDFKTVITANDTLEQVSLVPSNTVINRLLLTYSNDRVLYPYSINATVDQGKDFIRTGLTAKYYFNYADQKSGMSARLFAGKFFYLKPRTLATSFKNDRYALNMTGPRGDEDYTYSNYFAGRNEFEGILSQQIMERDGFFKVRTDLLSSKIGKTDDWLASLNLETDIPESINPLNVLPIKIPLKVFADVGTYAEAWKQNPATGRFLYDAGIQLPLFHSLVNVYIPLLYSKVYSNYFKSTITEKRFLKTISFSIDIQKLSAKQVLKNIPL